MDKKNKKNLKNIDKSSCLLSKEVLLFLEWLLIHDNKILDNFIKKIWDRGFKKINSGDISNELTIYSLDAQQVIFDFFSHLETTIDKLSKKKITLGKIKKEDKNIYNMSLEKNQFQENINSSTEMNTCHLQKKNSKNNNDNTTDISNIKEQSKKDFYKNFLQKWDTTKLNAE